MPRAIHFQGQMVAVSEGDQIVYSPAIRALERDHPNRRWVACLAILSVEIDRGAASGPYDEARAARFARRRLMPAAEFALLAEQDDFRLAQHFAVPIEQVRHRRVDLSAALG